VSKKILIHCLIFAGVLIYVNLAFLIRAKAILPPLIIIAIGSQIGAIFAITSAFFTGVFLSIYQFLKITKQNFKLTKKAVILIIFIIVLLSAITAIAIDKFQQRKSETDIVKSK
jgi:hypothetical protein